MLIDILCLIAIIYGFYLGFSRGIIKTVFDIASILIAAVFALKLSPIIIGIINRLISISPSIQFILGLVITFFLVMFAIRFIGSKMEDLLQAIKINFINKIIGGVLMSFIFVLMLSGMVWLGSELRLIDKTNAEKSISYPVLHEVPKLAGVVFERVKPLFSEFWDMTLETVDKIKEKSEGEG